MSSILPDELNGKLLDCPWTLTAAIQHAKMILSWYENISEEKRPPKSIWLDNQELNEWFKEMFGNKKNRNDYDQFIEVK